MNKRHKLLRRVFSTVMALVLAVSLLPTYAFAASVPAARLSTAMRLISRARGKARTISPALIP